MNWKGKPLKNYETIINLISPTKTRSGLKVKARLDKKRVKISKKEFNKVKLEFHDKFP